MRDLDQSGMSPDRGDEWGRLPGAGARAAKRWRMTRPRRQPSLSKEHAMHFHAYLIELSSEIGQMRHSSARNHHFKGADVLGLKQAWQPEEDSDVEKSGLGHSHSHSSASLEGTRTHALDRDRHHQSPGSMSLYSELSELWTLVRFCLFLPVTVKPPGGFRFELKSFISLATFLVWLALLPLFYAYSRERYLYVLNNFDTLRFYDRVPLKTSGFVITYFFFLPVSAWLDSKSLHELFTEWGKIEHCYKLLTGEDLQLGLKRRSRILTLTTIVLSCGLTPLISYITFDDYPALLMVPHIIMDLFHYGMTALWITCCAAVSRVAVLLADKMAEDQEHADRICAHRLLWQNLNDFLQLLGKSWTRTMILFLSYIFVMKTTTSFALMSVILNGQFNNRRLPVACFICLLYASYFFVIFNASYCAANQVKSLALKHLLRAKLSRENKERSREIFRFLLAMKEAKPFISLNGFLSFDRKAFFKASALNITYLIVLLQFAISVDENQQKHSPNRYNQLLS